MIKQINNYNLFFLLFFMLSLFGIQYCNKEEETLEKTCFKKVLKKMDKEYLCKEYFNRPLNEKGRCVLDYERLNMWISYNVGICVLEGSFEE